MSDEEPELACGQCGGKGTVDTASYAGVCHHCQGRTHCRYCCESCQIARLKADNARLRAALEAQRRQHAARCWAAVDGGQCDCGADEHNRSIDAALRGDRWGEPA